MHYRIEQIMFKYSHNSALSSIELIILVTSCSALATAIGHDDSSTWVFGHGIGQALSNIGWPPHGFYWFSHWHCFGEENVVWHHFQNYMRHATLWTFISFVLCTCKLSHTGIILVHTSKASDRSWMWRLNTFENAIFESEIGDLDICLIWGSLVSRHLFIG